VEEIDLKQVLKTAYKSRKILVYILIVTILLGIIYTFVVVRPEYTSSSKIIIGSNDTSIKEFVKSERIMQKVTEELNNSKVTTKSMKESTIASFDTASKVLSIFSTTKDKVLSNEIVHKYSDVLKTQLEEVYGIKNYKKIWR